MSISESMDAPDPGSRSRSHFLNGFHDAANSIATIVSPAP